MKAFFTATLLLVFALNIRPAFAFSQGPEHIVPTPMLVSTANCLVARPLVHYLVATLQLPDAQAIAVRRALQVNPLKLRTPEQIVERLQYVLTPVEFSRLLALQENVSSYEYLHFLAAR